ncbi:heavy metal translocating P-type ATPase [Hirschia litorea]|uniref:Heavy metal translocating P-type ATPase n=1 Tax=Hirschia litorea TaxID=1199156 RepID=A0ABW2IHE2_9PROT
MKDNNGIFSLDILVSGAKCGGCISKIEGSLHEIQGISSARMNLTTGKLKVVWDTTDTDPKAILSKLASLGYGATPFDVEEANTLHSTREKQLLLAMAVAGFATANVMLLSVSVWSGFGEMNPETREFLNWISACIAIPVVAFSGRPFFSSAYTAITSGNVNMDVPISLAVFLAIGMSVFETINHGQHTYFDASVMLLFFLLIGRFLDAKLQRKAHSAARDLALMQSASVTRLSNSQSVESVKASDINIGDILQISPGERFAVDCEIVSGTSDLDTRMVSGESHPIPSEKLSRIYAGTINLTKSLIVRALANVDDSMLAEVSALLDTGELKKSRYRKIADKAAQLYVPLVHTVAGSSFIAWVLYNGDIQHAIFIAIAVLIITCPCALALAAPVVQVVAIGKLFKKNVYLKSGDALERIAACDYVVFDKTGTLTNPEAELQIAPEDNEDLLNAAQLARGSRHPFSRALALRAGTGPLAKDIEEVPGCGITGKINGVYTKLGSANWVLGKGSQPFNESALYFKRESADAVQFLFSETIVSGTLETFAELTRRGLSYEVLSGDAPERVHAFATKTGADNWKAGISPVEKANRIAQLEAAGHKVLMIGDGFNDAGAIANAHASLTPGGAVDISRAASDGVFSGENIFSVIEILDIARQSKARMLENFAFAAVYNIIAISFAVFGFITPIVAAIAMSGSSLIVTLNALRLNLSHSSKSKSL